MRRRDCDRLPLAHVENRDDLRRIAMGHRRDHGIAAEEPDREETRMRLQNAIRQALSKPSVTLDGQRVLGPELLQRNHIRVGLNEALEEQESGRLSGGQIPTRDVNDRARSPLRQRSWRRSTCVRLLRGLHAPARFRL